MESSPWAVGKKRPRLGNRVPSIVGNTESRYARFITYMHGSIVKCQYLLAIVGHLNAWKCVFAVRYLRTVLPAEVGILVAMYTPLGGMFQGI